MAEISSARPHIVTEQRDEPVSMASMGLFDTQCREIQHDLNRERDRDAAVALSMQAQLAQLASRLQSRMPASSIGSQTQ